MDTTEPLCDLTMVKAHYDVKNTDKGDAGHFFEIKISTHHKKIHFDVPANDGELFAAELDVLASIIRARVMKARLTGR